MATVEQIAQHMRKAYAGGLAEGMAGPSSFFADRVEIRYVPSRPFDGFIDGKKMHAFQPTEAAVYRKVLPDGRLEDVNVYTRADDQIIVVMTMRGTLNDGTAFIHPVTMVYDVKGGKIVRVVGLYNQENMKVFEGAFREVAAQLDFDRRDDS
jgi:ketosteroid isomerase-like protein